MNIIEREYIIYGINKLQMALAKVCTEQGRFEATNKLLTNWNMHSLCSAYGNNSPTPFVIAVQYQCIWLSPLVHLWYP